jgi:hypothetical protein
MKIRLVWEAPHWGNSLLGPLLPTCSHVGLGKCLSLHALEDGPDVMEIKMEKILFTYPEVE